MPMRIFVRKTLKEFWELANYRDSEQPFKSWYDEVHNANWNTPNEIKAQYKNASILKNGRVVFNIHGNTYRLVVKINYDFGFIYVRFIGTHRQYDKINANEV
jgi:mRNA interferase HigB